MRHHSVIIAGAGPTGLMLACELALAGVDVAIVERRANQDLEGQRAGGLHARTIEILDQRGIADRFLDAGQTMQIGGFAWIPLDISDFPTRHNHGLALSQVHIERLLAERVAELNVPVYRSREITGLGDTGTLVDVQLSDGGSMSASYLVGCDGGRSTVRKCAGIGFPGSEATTSQLIAEVQVTTEPPWGLRHDERGIHAFSRTEDGAAVKVMVTEQRRGRAGEPSLDDLRLELRAVYGEDFGSHSPRWISRFTDAARQACAYRKGRVLLAGDAAHVHYPTGGQGLNVGIQDAMNLGWKLGQVISGQSTDQLLDSYHAERHPVAARVLQNTMAQVALLGPRNDRTSALRTIFADLLAMDGPRRKIAAMISGLDVAYDFGDGHPLLGRRVPDLELTSAYGPLRLYSLLQSARPLLLTLGEPCEFSIGPWLDRVTMVDAGYAGRWELPVIGEVPAPCAVLVRPDGHVAWVGTPGEPGLVEALTTWVGPGAWHDKWDRHGSGLGTRQV